MKIPGISVDLMFLFDADGIAARITLEDIDPDTLTDENVIKASIEDVKNTVAEMTAIPLEKIRPVTLEEYRELAEEEEAVH